MPRKAGLHMCYCSEIVTSVVKTRVTAGTIKKENVDRISTATTSSQIPTGCQQKIQDSSCPGLHRAPQLPPLKCDLHASNRPSYFKPSSCPVYTSCCLIVISISIFSPSHLILLVSFAASSSCSSCLHPRIILFYSPAPAKHFAIWPE